MNKQLDPGIHVTSPLSQVFLIYDLEQALATLRTAAKRFASRATYLPKDLMSAAVAFTIQLAIESGQDAAALRELERALIADIESATGARDPRISATPQFSTWAESGQDAAALRELERTLIADIESATGARDPWARISATPQLSTWAGLSAEEPCQLSPAESSTTQGSGSAAPHYRLTDDEIISVRDELIARGNIATLSVHDQNLFRDCDIALGIVRCRPETREEARARILRVTSQERTKTRNLRAVSSPRE